MVRHRMICGALVAGVAALASGVRGAGEVSIRIDTRMAPPRWAVLERRLLADNVPACQEFSKRDFDDRGYLLCFVRWGANDGPDDAFENFNRWPELHALGADEEILLMFSKGHEGLLKHGTPRPQRRTCRLRGAACTTRTSSSNPIGCTTAKGFSSSTAWGCRSQNSHASRIALGDSPACTWAPIPMPPTTILFTRSFAACKTAVAVRCCEKPRRSIGSATHSMSNNSVRSMANRRLNNFSHTTRIYTDVVGDHFPEPRGHDISPPTPISSPAKSQ